MTLVKTWVPSLHLILYAHGSVSSFTEPLAPISLRPRLYEALEHTRFLFHLLLGVGHGPWETLSSLLINNEVI